MVEIVLPVITIGIYQIITGCTLIGTAVGTFQDKKLPDYRTVDAYWKTEVLNKGAEIRVHTTEGETFKGKYIGDWQTPLSEFQLFRDVISCSDCLTKTLIHSGRLE
jgi:hypothetical protein